MELEIAPKVSDNDVWMVCQWMSGIESLHNHISADAGWKEWRERIRQVQREAVKALARRYFDAGRELQRKLDA